MHAICRCAKSWHTPRRFSKNAWTGVVTSVAFVSKLKSRCIFRMRSRTASSSGRSEGNEVARVVGEFPACCDALGTENKLVGVQTLVAMVAGQ